MISCSVICPLTLGKELSVASFMMDITACNLAILVLYVGIRKQ